MIEVKIPKEIKEYEGKYLNTFTFRELISVILTVIVAIGIYYFFNKKISKKTLRWLVIFISAPFTFFGFFKKNYLSFEKYIIVFLRSEFIYPRKRIYIRENCLEEVLKNKEVNID